MPFDGAYPRNFQRVILQDAKSLLESGWCQFNFKIHISAESSAYCAIGAYRQAYIDRRPSEDIVDDFIVADRLILPLLVKALPIFYRLGRSNDYTKVSIFNDRSWRMHRSILKLYDRAINQLKV